MKAVTSFPWEKGFKLIVQTVKRLFSRKSM